jgi:D-glycero-D-manno-heptose 1,7-bisphosphate phosphatase
MSNPALFLDRDGVLINYIPYLSHPDQVKLPHGGGEALRKWQDQGFLLIIISNQSGISRGYFSVEDVQLIHNKIQLEYAKFGVDFTEFFVCPHQPSEGCVCRKPSPFMILQAAKKYDIDLQKSFFIGDANSDLECATRAGCNPILLLTGRGEETLQKISNSQKSISIYPNLSESLQLLSNLLPHE